MRRYASEEAADDARAEEIKKERAEAWKQAQASRRRLVTIGPCRYNSKAQLDRHFEQYPMYKFAGKASESHRVFIFSADLFAEVQHQPWSCPPEWHTSAQPAIEFMLGQQGPGDVLVVCDGRSRSCRTKLEKLVEGARHQSEIWVVYKPSPRLGRKVSFASDNREVIIVSTPVSRTQLPTKTRTMYVGAGEASTHDSTYTGVEPTPWSAMPCISLADKAKICGFEPESPRPQMFDAACGQPLFWAERKSHRFWRSLLTDLDAKCVVDVTPGSGACARAALNMGISYLGVPRSQEHGSWLQNILDRDALQVITTVGSPLFQQELSHCIKEHFQDVLDQLNEADAIQDTAPEDGVDESVGIA